MDLEIVGKPTTLYCKPAPDHLPDAGACLATGITPQLCDEVGLPELRFVREVVRELGAPGTVGTGYNSVAFDDEVTRFMLWRNLMDPYEREWKNDCSRWDVMMAVRATYALRPDTMEWPRDDDGRVSLALERLSAANQLLHESAHDALSDVYTTIALARLVMERQPRLYAHCLAMRNKNLAMQEMNLERRQPFLHVGSGVSHSSMSAAALPRRRACASCFPSPCIPPTATKSSPGTWRTTRASCSIWTRRRPQAPVHAGQGPARRLPAPTARQHRREPVAGGVREP